MIKPLSSTALQTNLDSGLSSKTSLVSPPVNLYPQPPALDDVFAALKSTMGPGYGSLNGQQDLPADPNSFSLNGGLGSTQGSGVEGLLGNLTSGFGIEGQQSGYDDGSGDSSGLLDGSYRPGKTPGHGGSVDSGIRPGDGVDRQDDNGDDGGDESGGSGVDGSNNGGTTDGSGEGGVTGNSDGAPYSGVGTGTPDHSDVNDSAPLSPEDEAVNDMLQDCPLCTDGAKVAEGVGDAVLHVVGDLATHKAISSPPVILFPRPPEPEWY
jgi:hypothetical protein